MEFEFSEKEEALRREVQEFLADPEMVTDELLQEVRRDTHGARRGPEERKFYNRLKERGWVAISWPKEYGGQGGSRIDQYIVEEELTRAGFSVGRGGGGVPAIAANGTPEQKEKFVRPALDDDVYFASGYTEPAAGADLAGLKTTAVRDGDDFVINGQKVFCSAAHFCTHIYLMVRTDPQAERHSGISIFLVPIDTPGITVRPLWTVQNDPTAPPNTTYHHARTNEVFLDNVRVPAAAMLGKENEGWRLGQSGLNLDRVGAARYYSSVHLTEDAINLVRNDKDAGGRIREHAASRDMLVQLWIEAQVCRLFTMRSMTIVESGNTFSYEGSAEKVFAPEHAVKATEIIANLMGPYAQLLRTSPEAVEDGLYAHNLLGAYQSGVNHGSVQVMRDQMARRGLGLPSNR